MGWFYSATQQLQLVVPQHDQQHLPVPVTGRRNTSRAPAARLAARTSHQIVTEFRAKMKAAEDLISKLAFSLREIQGLRRRPAKPQALAQRPTEVVSLPDRSGPNRPK